MKKQITLLGFSVLMITAVTFSAFTQQKKDKNNKKEQQEKQLKNEDKKDKANKAKTGKDDNSGQPSVKVKHKEDHEEKEMHNKNGKNTAHGNNKKNDDVKHPNKVNKDKKDDDKWDRETFKDRNKVKNQEKVTVCHKFKSASEPAVTITVSANALKAHMNHGDVMGNCPAVTKKDFSDIFFRKRTDYYNSLQNSQEQVLYSRAVLDYALVRLTDSRSQLAVLQNKNAPVAVIKRKQATVAELEQNVSLLETLIGVAANMVVDKLQ